MFFRCLFLIRNLTGQLRWEQSMNFILHCKFLSKVLISQQNDALITILTFAAVCLCSPSCSDQECLLGFVKVCNRSTSEIQVQIARHDIPSQYVTGKDHESNWLNWLFNSRFATQLFSSYISVSLFIDFLAAFLLVFLLFSPN